MKNILKNIVTLFLLVITISCEDVVDIPLKNGTPKLVIDANLTWPKGTSGTNQIIKLSISNDFYTNEIKIASGAIVTVTDSDNTVFSFIQTPNTSDYVCNNFVPVINKEYTLKVIYEGETYTAKNKLLATPQFEPEVEQTSSPGLGDKEIIKVKISFQDNGLEDNYYLLSTKNPKFVFPEYFALEDRFTQGKMMYDTYLSEDLKKDDILKFSIQGITRSYYNYINKIISISGQNSGSPFTTPPAVVRGNIFNQTNEKNYPFGYFSLSEIDKKEYTIK